jgi:hypothetical protein
MWPCLPLQQRNSREAMFCCLWLFITSVSVHDGYLVALNSSVIMEMELNPVGRHLLHMADGEVAGLLATKAVGTVLACSLLLLLFWQSRPLGWAVAAGLATFQFGLLLYLTLT